VFIGLEIHFQSMTVKTRLDIESAALAGSAQTCPNDTEAVDIENFANDQVVPHCPLVMKKRGGVKTLKLFA
jgi:hypothetical protein